MKTLKQTFKESGIMDQLNGNLITAFNEALEDEKFKEFILKLKIDKSILSKYTSTLKKSCIEYTNCQNCKNIMECKNEMKGHAYLPIQDNNKLTFNYKACKHQEKIYKETSHLKYITLYQTPVGFTEATIKGIYIEDAKRKDIIKWIVNFVKDYPKCSKGLYLHGNFGCGKSYMICALLVELAKKGYYSTILCLPSFLQELKNYFNDNQEFTSIIKQIKNTPILFIDDIGAESLTSWSRDEILFNILDYRMNNNLITFFTSNLTIEELTQHFTTTKNGEEIIKAKRLIERIKYLAEDKQLISKNLRD